VWREVGKASGGRLGRRSTDGLYVAAEATDQVALPARRDKGGLERAVREVKAAERKGEAVEVIGRRHAVAKIAEPVAEIATPHRADEVCRRAVHRIKEEAGGLSDLGHRAVAEGANKMGGDLPLSVRQAAYLCDGITGGESGSVGGKERIAEPRQRCLPPEFGASATGSQ